MVGEKTVELVGKCLNDAVLRSDESTVVLLLKYLQEEREKENEFNVEEAAMCAADKAIEAYDCVSRDPLRVRKEAILYHFLESKLLSFATRMNILQKGYESANFPWQITLRLNARHCTEGEIYFKGHLIGALAALFCLEKEEKGTEKEHENQIQQKKIRHFLHILEQ